MPNLLNDLKHSIEKDDIIKPFVYSLRLVWGISGLLALFRLGLPQVQMSLNNEFFIYKSSSSSFIAFLFINFVVVLDFLLYKKTSLKRLVCLAISVSSTVVIFSIISSVLSFKDLSKNVTFKHIELNNYSSCDDGYESRSHKSGFDWVLVSKKMSHCHLLRLDYSPFITIPSKYDAYKKRIEALNKAIEQAKNFEKNPKTKTSVSTQAMTIKEEITPKETIAEQNESTPLLSHRFLYYGEGEVMIKNFDYLPESVKKEIRKVTIKKPTQDYIKFDLTKFLPEILKSYGMSKYIGINFEGEVQFKFSKVTLIHSTNKGDCNNYPDTYISLVSNDFKKMINGRALIGYPKTEFIVFPAGTKKIKDKELIKALEKKMSLATEGSDSDSEDREFYQVKDKVYALIGNLEMNLSYEVFECTENCVNADYYLEHPPCGY